MLAYGQTGSGKTYSMGGCYEASLSQDEMAMGIIPRILRDLFRGIADRPEYNFQVCVSYLEVIHCYSYSVILRFMQFVLAGNL